MRITPRSTLPRPIVFPLNDQFAARADDANPAPEQVPPPKRRGDSMLLAFGAFAVGLVIAALANAALSWDGGIYLFQLLDRQRPFLTVGRQINWPLHWPVIWASHLTNDLPSLQLVFGLVYATIPLLALAASWIIVRDRARHLFVWAALGIGLGLLPGQFYFVAEAMIAVQLTWPIILAIMTGLRRQHAPLVALCAVALLVSHPFALPLLIFAAGLAFVVGAQRPGERRGLHGWGAGLALLAVVASVRLFVFRSPYESEQLSLTVLSGSFRDAVLGLPLVALGCAWLAALAIFAAARWRRSLLHLAALVAIAGSGVILVLWARDPSAWARANLFTHWTVFASAPFFALAAIEGLSRRATAPDVQEARWAARLRASQLAAVVFALVLIVQSVVWINLTSQLRAAIAASPWRCIALPTIPAVADTPLDVWTTSSYALLLQGATPQKLVLPGEGCGEASFARGINLSATPASASVRTWNDGWFNLQPLRQGLTAEGNPAPTCWFMPTTGWHQTETSGQYWWRWSNGRDAQIRVVLDRDATVTIGGQIETAAAPNQIAITVNGQSAQSIAIPATGLRTLTPLSVPLRAGTNVIQLVSQNPPVPAAVDGRPLAISVANLTMSVGGTNQQCQFRR